MCIRPHFEGSGTSETPTQENTNSPEDSGPVAKQHSRPVRPDRTDLGEPQGPLVGPAVPLLDPAASWRRIRAPTQKVRRAGRAIAHAGRDGRARLHDPKRTQRTQRTRQALQQHDAGEVDVTAHDEVGAGSSPRPQRGRMPAQSVRLVLATRDGDRLVHHDHAQLRRLGMRHMYGDTVGLQRAYLAILLTPGSRGVEAHHQEFRRAVHGLENRPERGAVPPMRAVQARCVMSPDSTTPSARCWWASVPRASTTAPCSVPKCVSDICSRTLKALPLRRCPDVHDGCVALGLQQVERFGQHVEVEWRSPLRHFAVEGHLCFPLPH